MDRSPDSFKTSVPEHLKRALGRLPAGRYVLDGELKGTASSSLPRCGGHRLHVHGHGQHVEGLDAKGYWTHRIDYARFFSIPYS